MSTFYIGLKMGSTTTCIYKSGNGIVLKEASLIAMPTNPRIHEVQAIGDNAKRLVGRLPENISVFSPISNGTIQYESLAVYMLKGFLKKVFPNRHIGQNIKAVVSIPLGLSPEEKKAYEITCFKAGISDVALVPDVLCFAVGNGLNIQDEKAEMIVDIGGDTTNIAIISNTSIIQGFNLSIGGSIINAAISKYIEQTHGLLISNEQAEHIKLEICSLFETFQASIEVEGFNVKTQNRSKINVNSAELFPIIKHYYGKIAEAVKSIVQSSAPQTINDIMDSGIYYYGGGAMIIGLEKFMYEKTCFKVNLSDNSRSNIVGTGELIKYPQLLKKILKNT